MATDFLKLEIERGKKVNRFMALLLAVMAASGGIVLYVTLTDYVQERLALSETECELSVNSTFALGKQASEFSEIANLIEDRRGYARGSLEHVPLQIIPYCHESTGFWYDYPEMKKKFVYCIGIIGDGAVEFDVGDCEKSRDNFAGIAYSRLSEIFLPEKRGAAE